MKILISEDQKNNLMEVIWKDSIINHIKLGRFPLTTKVRKALYGEKEVTTFHISDIDNIDNTKQLIGTKKTISSFTYMNEDLLKKLSGVKTIGGIIYEIKGNLVLHSHTDIMSRPDENGQRWIDISRLLPKYNEHGGYINSLNEIWTTYIRSTRFRNNANMLDDKSYGIDRTNFIRNYITKAQDYILNNIDEIKNYLENDKSWGEWNEVLVSDIKIHDILWDESTVLNRIKEIESQIVSNDNTNNNRKINKDVDLIKNKINHKLKSMSTGTVYSIPTPNTQIIKNFISERGGFMKRNEYYEKQKGGS